MAAAGYKVTPSGEFGITLEQLANLNQDQMTEENKTLLVQRGGVQGVAKLLGVDVTVGLSAGEKSSLYASRTATFGVNVSPEPPADGFCKLFIMSFNDPVLIVLMVAAAVSLVIGFIEDPTQGWIEGVAIFMAVLLVSTITAINDYKKEQQFRKLKGEADDIKIKVLRQGEQESVSTHKILCGDVVILDTGDKIPADGVYISGDGTKCNEASLTGEPDDLSKDSVKDPFLLSGCTVTDGLCRMLVIAVGPQSRWGRIKAKLATAQKDTPLMEKLNRMVVLIGYVGIAFAVGTFLAQLIMWFAGGAEFQAEHHDKLGRYLLEAFIICVTIIVVAIPEGLPLAVTISLAYSTQKMLKDQNLIRVLAACETMGNATNICSDKTGTLTQNQMTVVAGWFAGRYYEEGALPSDIGAIKGVLAEGISLNSNAVVGPPVLLGGKPEVTGSKTEGALLMMLESFGSDWKTMRKTAAPRVLKTFPFSSKKKSSCVLVEQPGGGVRMYVKGASEIVLGMCDKALGQGGGQEALDEHSRAAHRATISKMAQQALRTIGVAHADLDDKMVAELGDLSALQESPDVKLTLECIVGIIDPLREDVIEAVKTCHKAGIMVRMVTGDNVETATAIARGCGILTEGGIVLEGPAFRKMTPDALDRVLPKLQVLARSSPDDKHVLVTRLNGKELPAGRAEWEELHVGRDWETERSILLPGYKDEWRTKHKLGQVVGVTGDGTNDAPALKAGDVGLAMGITGTDVAKEASDIVIMDDKFSSIVQAVLWGRSVYDNIRKFLQFQLTVNVVALTLTFISAVTGQQPPLNAVMMLWVNLIMDTMGALALGTEAPTADLLERKPYKRETNLVSNLMARNIIIQSLFQLVVLHISLYVGVDLWGCSYGNTCLEYSKVDHAVCAKTDFTHYSLIFNIFVFCQVFNEFNARSIGNKMNCFAGIFDNAYFLIIIFITVLFQVMVIEGFGTFTKTIGLSAEAWLWSIVIGAVSLPLGVVMRLVPPQIESPDSFANFASDTAVVTAGDAAAPAPLKPSPVPSAAADAAGLGKGPETEVVEEKGAPVAA